MATYLELRNDAPNRRGEHAIRLVISTGGTKTVRKNTGFHVLPKYWDDRKGAIRSTHPNAIAWNAALERKLNEARDEIANMDMYGQRVDAAKVVKAMAMGGRFKDIAEHYAAEFLAAGKPHRYKKISSLANLIEDMYPGIKAVHMNEDWAKEYRKQLEKEKKLHNTIIARFKDISSVLRKAKKDKFIPKMPLEDLTIGSFHKMGKDSLDGKELNALWEYEPSGKWQYYAKWAWLFSYYATGARFKDVMLMPRDCTYERDGELRIKWQPNKTRKNTGEWIDIPVNERLQVIIKELNSDSDAPTLFGLATPGLDPLRELAMLDSIQVQINKSMKAIMLQLRVAKNITFHCARHTFGITANKRTGRDVYVIKDAMGHSDIASTEFYLGKDQGAVDELTRKVYGA